MLEFVAEKASWGKPVAEGRGRGIALHESFGSFLAHVKTPEGIIHHVAEDSLVLTGWNPAEGRSKPPLSHAEFAAKMREWIEKGAAIPE